MSVTITNELRDQAFERAAPSQQKLCADPESGHKLRVIAEKHGLGDKDQYLPFVLLVGDTVLGLRLRTDLPTLFTQDLRITTEAALRLTADVLDFIDHTDGDPMFADTSIHNDIAEAEAALESLPQVRTMAGDMHTNQPPIVPPPEPTITATSQDTLLAKPTPPTVSDTPRWDSDTNR